MKVSCNARRYPRIIAAVGVLVASAGAQSADPEMQTPSAERERPGPVLDAKVDQILTRLEARTITDLRCKVRWDIEDAITDDRTSKFGTLYYLARDPVAAFKVEFTDKVDGQTKRRDKLDEQHLFDGHWYVERNGPAKSVTRREVRAASDKRDPYKLGEGAFPLPFGQRKADILREFEVSRVEKDESGAPPDADHLLLVPHPGTSTHEQYRSVEFWIARENSKLAGLPVKVRAKRKDGTGRVNAHIVVTFSDVDLAAGVSDAVFKIDTPPGFHEEIVPLAAPEKLDDIKIEDMKPAE